MELIVLIILQQPLCMCLVKLTCTHELCLVLAQNADYML